MAKSYWDDQLSSLNTSIKWKGVILFIVVTLVCTFYFDLSWWLSMIIALIIGALPTY